jgi:uncharacterized membrane protein YdjX (TVP38/TMEM64 family)
MLIAGVIHFTVGFSFLHPSQIQGMGLWAVVGYGCVMVLAGGFGLPPVVMIVPASAVWPVSVALPLCYVGGFYSSWLGFGLARFGFQRSVERAIPERLKRFELQIESHGFTTVLLMRLMFYLFPPVNWMLGMSGIPGTKFVLGTLIGMIPWTLVYVLTGNGLFAFLLGLFA